MIRLSKAFVGEDELNELRKVFLESVHFGLGSHVEAFEKALKEFIRADVEVIGVNSGTSALHIALEGLQLPKGSEIIIPSITFAASYTAALQAGLVPVSCDVTFPSCHIDVEDARRRVTPKTAAIMPVAYSGTDFNREDLYRLATEHGLRVVEDDAHAFGCVTRDGKMFGASGDIVCFSFDGIKNITCGEGGAVVTRDKEVAKRIRVLRGLGIEPDVELRYQGQRAWEYNITTLGFRYHMSNINAAVGIAQLRRLPSFKEKKSALVAAYHSEIVSQELSRKVMLTQSPRDTDILHIFPVLLPQGCDRSKVRAHLKEAGFESGFHYVPNHQHSLFRSDYRLPVAEDVGRRTLSLPFHPGVEVEAVPRIVAALKAAMQHAGAL